jgi:signal transduction histidine kinase
MLRFSWILMGISVMLGWTMWLAFRLYKHEGSVSARWLAYVHGFTAMVLLLRVVRVSAGMTLPDPLTPTWDSALTTLGMCVMSVFGSVAILGLYLERSTRREVASAFEREQNLARKRVEHELAYLDRQRSLGELAAAMAHEISQPLTAVSVECGLLQREVAQTDPQVRGLVDRIGRNVDHAAQILHGIRNFIQPMEPELKPLSLLAVIDEVLQMLPISAKGSAASIILQAEEAVPCVRGDFVQLSQVVLNILRNSEQAQAPGTPLQIVLRLQSIEGNVRLSIEDDGPGFSSEALVSAGQAFSTTKTGGMGIGIAISRRIIKLHGGTLHVGNRKDGVGALVCLDLPALEETY